MKTNVRIAAVVMISLFVLFISGNLSFAEEKKPIRFKVINTFKTDLPGIEKAQFIEFEMDPGAKIEGLKVGASEILWVTKGIFTYTYGDKVVKRKKGESWFQEIGTVLDVKNNHKRVAVLRGIQFIRAK
jgi:quercetin dioxygenase-like cupin family protein